MERRYRKKDVVAPTGEAPFVYSYMQTRLIGRYNGK